MGDCRDVRIHRTVGSGPSCQYVPDLSPSPGACTEAAAVAGDSRGSAEAGCVPVVLAPGRVVVAELPGPLVLGLAGGVERDRHSQMLCLACFASPGRPYSHSSPIPVRRVKLAAGAERRGCR